jgi:anti-sigma regulatory factor (Ser/Thr protein kinase)
MRAALDLAHQVRSPLPSSIHLVEHQWTYQIENDISAVGPFVDALLKQFATNLPLQILADLNIAIRELILNGIEHGNLGISYAAKTAALEEGTLHTALKARASQMPYLGRRVTVNARQSETEIKVQITDEGEGFEWNALPDPTASANLLSDHGRGILLAGTAVDSLTYNDRGNEVTIIKNVGDEE